MRNGEGQSEMSTEMNMRLKVLKWQSFAHSCHSHVNKIGAKGDEFWTSTFQHDSWDAKRNYWGKIGSSQETKAAVYDTELSVEEPYRNGIIVRISPSDSSCCFQRCFCNEELERDAALWLPWGKRRYHVIHISAETLKVQSEDIMRRYNVLCFTSSNCDSSSADRCKFSWPPGDPVDQSEDPNQRARRWPISRRYMEAGAEFFSQ